MASFTDLSIKKMKPKVGKGDKKMVTRFYDRAHPGLQMVVSPAGTKTFAYIFSSPTVKKLTAKGKEVAVRRSITLGRYPGLSLKDARNQIDELRLAVRSGVDPIEQKEQAEREQASVEAVGTVKDLFDFYIEDLTNKGRASVPTIQGAYNRDISRIGHMRACDVSGQDVAHKVLGPIFKRGSEVQANRVRSYLHAAFKLGMLSVNSAKYADSAPDFCLTHNPVALVPREGKESVGERWLSKDEVNRLWSEIGSGGLIMRKENALALKLILSTGQRVEEVLGATWAEIDFDSAEWTIPGSRRKTAWRSNDPTDHIIPLTSLHIGLLRELQGLAKRGTYLFPNADGTGPRASNALLLSVNRYCKGSAKREPFPRFTPKNLRPTFKTLAGEARISKEIRDRLQGHAFSDVASRHYDKYDYLDEKREGMEQWCQYLENITGDQTGKVVPLRREA